MRAICSLGALLGVCASIGTIVLSRITGSVDLQFVTYVCLLNSLTIALIVYSINVPCMAEGKGGQRDESGG